MTYLYNRWYINCCTDFAKLCRRKYILQFLHSPSSINILTNALYIIFFKWMYCIIRLLCVYINALRKSRSKYVIYRFISWYIYIIESEIWKYVILTRGGLKIDWQSSKVVKVDNHASANRSQEITWMNRHTSRLSYFLVSKRYSPT